MHASQYSYHDLQQAKAMLHVLANGLLFVTFHKGRVSVWGLLCCVSSTSSVYVLANLGQV